MMQNKLQGLVGRSSGYVESLPAPVRRRVAGLKGVQKEHAKLEAEFQEEVLALEKRFFAKFTPLYEKRAKIVNGQSEPSEEEVKAGEEDEEEEEAEEAEKVKKETDEAAGSAGADVKGIPEFWLSAMKNSSLAETITDRDEEALKHLTDIRMEYLDRPGFRLIFEFAENEFFTNKTLSKTYFYQEENGYGGDFIYDHAEGEKIEWKSGKDLTVKVESKKQRNKSASSPAPTPLPVHCFTDWCTADTKQTRIVKKTIPTPSFFDFFNPATPPADDDEEIDDDIEAKLELDYQLGEDIKEKLIPRAIDWFTGEALQFEQGIGDFDEDEFEDEDDEDEDTEERDDEDEEEDEDDEVSCSPDLRRDGVSLCADSMTGGWSEAQARDGRVQAELDVWADADSHQPTGRRHHLNRKAQAEPASRAPKRLPSPRSLRCSEAYVVALKGRNHSSSN